MAKGDYYLDWLYCKNPGNPNRWCECDRYWDCIEIQSCKESAKT